ncbi:MAG: acyl-CoA thioesterase [Sedimenticola sp.]|nr:MAG: acyl-CoA thioesterase [Sedimenticola sp.]
MENYVHVRPEHLNHHGFLFGGVLLMWVDESAWMTASLDYPDCTMVTAGMDKIIFKHRVENGAILRFVIRPSKKGRKSIQYGVTVFSDEPGNTEEKEVFTTSVTFVRIDQSGKAINLPERSTLRSELANLRE